MVRRADSGLGRAWNQRRWSPEAVATLERREDGGRSWAGLVGGQRECPQEEEGAGGAPRLSAQGSCGGTQPTAANSPVRTTRGTHGSLELRDTDQ